MFLIDHQEKSRSLQLIVGGRAGRGPRAIEPLAGGDPPLQAIAGPA